MKIFGWPLLLFASSLGVVFSQAVGNGTPRIPYSHELALATCLGAIIWIIKRLLTHTIPEKDRVFQETLDKIVERGEQHDKLSQQSLDRWMAHCRAIQPDPKENP